MSTTVELIDAELQILPLAELHESPLNPRTYFAEAKLKELADSIKGAGVRVPLVCRPRVEGGGYEIGAGHRRYRAAKLAGVERVPVIVRDMTDLDFLDMLAFENGNREDLHPLEEAAGWQTWMRETLSDIPSLIAKTGHKLGYVYGRLKLLDAIDEAKRACWEDKIKPGHLLLIARLDAEDQPYALRHCQPPEWAPEADVSVRDLAQWIKKNVNVALDRAPFDREDPGLVPAAGPCGPCMYRSGNAPDFNVLEDLPDICTRRSCYNDKVAAHAATIPKPYFPEQPAAPPPAPAPKPAGQTAEERKLEAARRKKEQDEETERQRAWAEQQERERAAAQQKIDAEKSVRSKIVEAILSKVKWPPSREDVLPLLVDIALPVELDGASRLAGIDPSRWGRDTAARLSEQNLARLIVLIAVADDFDGDFSFGRGCDTLNAAAKRYGVNPAEFRKPAKAKEDGTRREVIKQLPAVGSKKPAKPPAKKPPAKKAAKPVAAKKGKGK